MSAASECYLNFIMVGIYLVKNDFNSRNYVFFPKVTQFSLHRYIATLGYIYILLFFVMLVIADITCNDSAYYSVVTSNPAHGEVYSIQPQY
jgi:hypothetical protein